MASHPSLPRWCFPGDCTFPRKKRQDDDKPHLQSSSRGRWNLLAGAVSMLLLLLPPAVHGLCWCCCRALHHGCGVGWWSRSSPSLLAQGVQPQELTGFFAISGPCTVHFETVSNCKMQFLERQTQGCHKRERLYSNSLLSWSNSDWVGHTRSEATESHLWTSPQDSPKTPAGVPSRQGGKK